MLDVILNHRSIRKYKSNPISPELLNNILEAGTRASNTGNMQAYSIIVSQAKDVREKLWEVHFKQNMVLQAPVTLTFCADFNRFSQWCLQRKASPGFDNFLSFINAAIDALLASQNVAIEAEANGLGICYLGTTTYNADKIIDILKLPQGVVPVTTLVVGYPDETPGLTDRLPLNAVIHHEVYQEYSPEAIDRFFDEKDNSDFTRKLLEINNKETLAQIFTDNRYTKKDNEFFSKAYLEVIKKQGFMNQ
ncbi:MAG: nitroreductase family protein [Bacteroidota bacterium]|nr:nitroreductase family protein [Bacteroidota bacterium]